MKKMSIFGLLAVLVLSFASVAQAADIKATGTFNVESTWTNSLDFNTMSKDQTFHIEQRIRTAFQFIANENLKGVLDLQIGSQAWGNGFYQVSAGRTPNTTGTGSLAAGNGNIMLRKGYIDFKWPGTKVNFLVGYQTVSLPAAFGGGSAILDDQVGAAIVSAPITDNLSILAGYARPYDANTYGATAAVNGHGTSADVAFAALPVTLKGFSIVPFGAFMYAGAQAAAANTGATSQLGFSSSGSNASVGTRGYWGGVAFTMTAFEPFKVMADFNYGKATYSNYTLADSSDGGRQGWLFDFAVDYTGLSMMTPEFFFVYMSGEKGFHKDKSGRMPIMGNPQSWTVNNSFFFGDRNFISGFSSTTAGASYSGSTRNVAGFWTTGVSLKDVKLVDNFTHQVNLMYIKGTNDSDYVKTGTASLRPGANYGAMLTDKDHLWEIDLNTKYKVYDGLTLNLDLGYINASIDKDTWRFVNANYGNNNDVLVSNAYRIALGMAYSF